MERKFLPWVYVLAKSTDDLLLHTNDEGSSLQRFFLHMLIDDRHILSIMISPTKL